MNSQTNLLFTSNKKGRLHLLMFSSRFLFISQSILAKYYSNLFTSRGWLPWVSLVHSGWKVYIQVLSSPFLWIFWLQHGKQARGEQEERHWAAAVQHGGQTKDPPGTAKFMVAGTCSSSSARSFRTYQHWPESGEASKALWTAGPLQQKEATKAERSWVQERHLPLPTFISYPAQEYIKRPNSLELGSPILIEWFPL